MAMTGFLEILCCAVVLAAIAGLAWAFRRMRRDGERAAQRMTDALLPGLDRILRGETDDEREG